MPNNNNNSNNSKAGFGAMLGLGIGTAGLAYMVYYGRNLAMQRNMPFSGQQQMKYFHPEVQRRISQSLSYFGGGLLITGGLVGALRNSRLANMNPLAALALMLVSLIGTEITNYNTNKPMKHLLWTSFMGSIAVSMIPLINMAGMPIVFDALFATGFTMGGLGLVAYNAPSEQFLNWGGMLGMCCAGMIGISFA